MSPEQLEAREADARADVFSFGAVFYEMVSGRKAFEGKTTANLTAAILKEGSPSLSTLQPTTPDALDHAVQTCLAKDPDARWQSARDLELELRWIVAGLGQVRGHRASLWRSRARVWIAAAVLMLAVTGILTIRQFGRSPVPARMVRSSLTPPENSHFVSVGTNAGPAVLSADGSSIAFVGSSPDGRTLLWVRRLDSLAAQAIGGTDSASHPFWSPDGSSIGFFADQKLKRVSPSGGSVVTLADAPFGAGGAWSPAGVIVFGPDLQGPLLRVPASGGTATPATVLAAERREGTHRWPSFLPDGRRFLYLSNEEGPPRRWSIRVGSLDSTVSDFILEVRSNATYHDGYLLFVRGGTLLAQRFDPKGLKVTGEAVPLAEQVRHDALMARSVFSVSAEGTLAYESGATGGESRMVWVGRNGKELAVLGEPAPYTWPQISPDGKRVAATVIDAGGNRDIWIYEIADGRAMRLTFDPADEGNPTWMPDGRRVVFNSNRKGVRDLHWTAASGSGMPDVLLESGTDKFPQAVSPDGRYLIYAQRSEKNYDLWLLSFADRRPVPFIAAEGNQTFGQFSPDGRWFAYDSSESGTPEVYVTPFPSERSKWLVSRQGGIMPKWRQDGREIFYLSPDHHTVFAAGVTAGEENLRVTRIERLFTTQAVTGVGYPYDVSADGNRFLFVTGSGETSSPLTLVVNWTAELKR